MDVGEGLPIYHAKCRSSENTGFDNDPDDKYVQFSGTPHFQNGCDHVTIGLVLQMSRVQKGRINVLQNSV